MRVLPILAAATIGLFATAAMAQSSNTADPNSAPGASSTGGKAMRPAGGEIKKMDTTDPNSAPGATTKGRKSAATSGQSMDTVDKGNPNRPGDAMKVSKKKHKKMKKHM